jgi:6-phosphogluconolactonase (cycloisomerase 2 family)
MLVMKCFPVNPPSSRRNFLKTASAVAVANSISGWARSIAAQPAPDRVRAYVGTYTADGGGGNGEGIYLFDLHEQTGELLSRRLVAKTPSPSWIAIHPSRRYLYAVNEVGDFNGSSGSVSAFAINPVTGDLTALNSVSSEGAGPAYLSIDAAGKFAFVANYGGGTIAVLPILASGSLEPAVDVHRDEGSLGSAQAASAPGGSFAISGHDAPHAHMILPDPQNRFVLATDLGQDRIYSYHYDADTGKLTPRDGQTFFSLPSGDGPRHLAFHPDGHWLYSIDEESSTIVFFLYDATTGKLTPQHTLSALPQNFAGTSFASEILVSPDGHTLYAANRLHDTIAAFHIEPDGVPKPIGEISTMGDYPVQTRIDPTGNFLFACNRHSDCITSFKIHRETGLLTFTGQYTAVGSPGSITFL